MARKGNGKNMGAAQELRNYVDRVVALEIERKRVKAEWKEEDDEFKEGIASVYEEAGGKGYDEEALKLSVKRRHESAQARARRQEIEALADLYSAAIGDLSGKPLDDMTRRRIDEQMRKAQGEQPPAEPSAQQDLPEQATTPAEPPETAEQAKAKGKQARKEGARVVDNPYHSSSPLRAAWDEGWCEEDGSDGMEIPAAWRREKPPEEEKKADGDGEDDKKPPAPPAADGAQPPQQA